MNQLSCVSDWNYGKACHPMFLFTRLLLRLGPLVTLVTLNFVQLQVGRQLLCQLHHDRSADIPRDAQAPNIRPCLDGDQHQGSSCITCNAMHKRCDVTYTFSNAWQLHLKTQSHPSTLDPAINQRLVRAIQLQIKFQGLCSAMLLKTAVACIWQLLQAPAPCNQ